MPNDQILDAKARAEMPPDLNPGSSRWKRFWAKYKVIVFAIVAVILVVGIFWFFLSKSTPVSEPQSTHVSINIDGPTQITSGNEAQYKITIQNNESADLVSGSLDLLYPTGFTFKSADPTPATTDGTTFNVPIIRRGQSMTITVRGDLSGSTGEDKQIKTILNYSLSNFSSQFEVSQSVHTSILAPNLVLDLNGPVDVINGQDVTFTATVTNVSGQAFDNLVLQLTYPAGFSYTNASVQPAQGNNSWNIGHLDPNGSQSIDIQGNFTGNDNSQTLVMASLGEEINGSFASQVTSTVNFQIIPSSVTLSLTANPQANITLGSSAQYKLDYENRGTIGLNNIILAVDIESPFVDYSHISAPNAILSGHTLTWKAGTLAALTTLSPSESGEVTFTVPTIQALTTNLKNQMIAATATITSDEINTPTKAPELDLKLISQLGLQVSGNYVSGALPMTVGQTTLINVTFLVTNASNDLSNTTVVGSLSLPPSSWSNVIVPQSEASELSFDPNSDKITWNIGNLPAFTGQFSPSAEVTFQLAVTPQTSDQGKEIQLLSNIQATGMDSFVSQQISSRTISNITPTNLGDKKFQNSGTVK